MISIVKRKSRQGLEKLGIYGDVEQFVIFKRVVRIDLTEKMTFEQRFDKGVTYVDI